MKRFPWEVLRILPGAIMKALGYKMKKRNAKELKQQLFSFLKKVPDTKSLVESFWDVNNQRMASWYLLQKKSDDVIISASPDFLLRPQCEKLGVFLIATDMDPDSGKIRGENCHDREKTIRFRKQFPNAHIDSFYSDSLSDTPMAELAGHAFLVKKDRLYPWPKL